MKPFYVVLRYFSSDANISINQRAEMVTIFGNVRFRQDLYQILSCFDLSPYTMQVSCISYVVLYISYVVSYMQVLYVSAKMFQGK